MLYPLPKLATKTENPDYDNKYLKQVVEEAESIFSNCTNTTEEVNLKLNT